MLLPGRLTCSAAKITLTFILACIFAIPASAQPLGPKYRWADIFSGSRSSLINVTEMIYGGNGTIYVTGIFRDTIDFDPGPGTSNLVGPRSGTYAFICKLDRNGGLIWAKAPEGKIVCQGMALDPTGNLYITGSFTDTVDFDPSAARATVITSNKNEAFVCKLSPAGNFLWVKTFYGPSSQDFGLDIKIDAAGNVVVAGGFAGTVDFDPGTGVRNLTASGTGDAFVCKLDPAGALQQVWQLGGSGSDVGSALALDSRGNMYALGLFDSKDADFDPGSGSASLAARRTDFFLAKLDQNGNYIWAKKFTGAHSNFGTCLRIGRAGSVYISGNFVDTADIDPANPLIGNGPGNSFIAKLDADGHTVWSKSFSGAFLQNASLAIDRKDNLYSGGSFSGTIDFDPDTGVYNLNCPTTESIYVTKLDSAGRFVWAGALNGPFSTAHDVVVDDSGFVHVSGYVHVRGLYDFDPGAGVQNIMLGDGTLGIVFKWAEGIVITNPSSVNNLNARAPVKLFPQPAPDRIFIRCEDASLIGQAAVIYSQTGMVVAEVKLTAETTLDVSHWASGMYFLRLPDGRAWKMVRE